MGLRSVHDWIVGNDPDRDERDIRNDNLNAIVQTGAQLTRTAMGRVADFCFFCRQLRAHQLFRLGLGRHVLWITISKGETVGYERRCEVCGGSFVAKPRTYQTIANSRRSDLAELIETTYPAVRSKYEDRLKLEEKIKSRAVRLATDEREFMLHEPFVLLRDIAAERYTAIHVDWKSCVAFWLAFFLTPPVSNFVKNAATLGGNEIAETVLPAVIWLPLLFLLVTDRVRFLNRKIYPKLVRALAPLDPTADELDEVLRRISDTGAKIGRKVSARKLRRLIAARQQDDPAVR